MKVGFFCSGHERCKEFGEVFAKGVQKAGDTCEVRPVLTAHRDEGNPLCKDGAIVPDVDVAVIYAVLHKKAFATMREANIPIIYMDKAYNRNWEYRRISIGAHQPTHYLGKMGCPDNRRMMFGWIPRLWRKPYRTKGHVLMAWSDERDHEWRGWSPPETHAQVVADGLKYFTSRELVYRSKPNRIISNIDRVTISVGAEGTRDLMNAYVLVTPGTSLCLQALLLGIPTIVLDDALVRNISSTCICQVENPYLASQEEQLNLLNDLAYCQWHTDEYANGKVWHYIKPWVTM